MSGCDVNVRLADVIRTPQRGAPDRDRQAWVSTYFGVQARIVGFEPTVGVDPTIMRYNMESPKQHLAVEIFVKLSMSAIIRVSTLDGVGTCVILDE